MLVGVRLVKVAAVTHVMSKTTRFGVEWITSPLTQVAECSGYRITLQKIVSKRGAWRVKLDGAMLDLPEEGFVQGLDNARRLALQWAKEDIRNKGTSK